MISRNVVDLEQVCHLGYEGVSRRAMESLTPSTREKFKRRAVTGTKLLLDELQRENGKSLIRYDRTSERIKRLLKETSTI